MKFGFLTGCMHYFIAWFSCSNCTLYCQLSDAGGRLIIASDGIWDALPSEVAAKSSRGLPADLAAVQVVKVIYI